jgi:hypothetical protein
MPLHKKNQSVATGRTAFLQNKSLADLRKVSTGRTAFAIGPQRKIINPIYQIIIRSFIAAEKVGFGPSVFLGDNRGPSAETGRNIGFRAMHKFDVFVTPDHAFLRTYRERSSATIGILPGASAGSPPIILTDHAQTRISPSRTTQSKNSLGQIITSFETSYWAKDPITPQFATPALDVHAQFALTSNEERGLLSIATIIRGDSFPSTEVILLNPSGRQHILLGAHMEKGGLPDLFGDNNNLLIDINLQIKFDSQGNFFNVRRDLENFPVSIWNQRAAALATSNQ